MSVILTCNAGSTNTKLALFDKKTLERTRSAVTYNAAETMAWMRSVGDLGIAAIGHRVVHGGREFTPTIERRLPLPHWYHQQGIQRYGFHGLSYQHVADVLRECAKDMLCERVIVAHLGGGSSACAMKNLKSIATTMGFSTLDGMMMGTRCGALDAGVVLHLLQELKMKLKDIERLLYHESGLLGISGFTADMKQLLGTDTSTANEAVKLYCYLAARQIAGLLPALGGLDVLIFTGGIGENSASIRDRIVQSLNFAGNFPALVIPTDEERVIAYSCRNLINRRA